MGGQKHIGGTDVRDLVLDHYHPFIIFERRFNMEELLNAIGAVGFPIVAYGAMFWYMVQLNALHKEELNMMRSSLDQNTQALLEMRDLLIEMKNEEH